MRKNVLIVLILLEHNTNGYLPWGERNVRIGKLIAHEPWSVTVAIFLFLLSQMLVQDARHPIDFFGVAFNGTGHLFRVIFLEPGQLSIVWALSRFLEVEPLFRVIRLWCSGSKTQLVFRVVALDQILDNGTGLPQSDAGIGVVDGWYAKVGVSGDVFRPFDIGERDRGNLVRKIEFF